MAETIYLPSGMGKGYTYMEWRNITSPSSNQYKLREQATANGQVANSPDGKITINGRTLVAMTDTFGNVGDYVDIQTADGTMIYGIIGDIKNQNDSGANKWGHRGGDHVVEFITSKKLSQNYPGNGGVISVTNTGNYFNGDNHAYTSPSTVQTGYVEDKATSIFQKIFIFLVCVCIGVVGVYFFLRAFGISKQKIISSVVESKTGIDLSELKGEE